jgi:hypothetical protein
LKSLGEKRWDTIELLALPSLPASLEPAMMWLDCRIVIYIDGRRFGAHHIIRAVGVDREGRKHILGLATILGRKTGTEISQDEVTNMKAPSSVLQSLQGISSALDNHSIRCFDFSVTEI